MLNQIRKLLIVILFFSLNPSFSRTFTYSEDSTQVYDLIDYLQVFEDTTRYKSVNEVIFQKFSPLTYNHFGHTDSGIWYKFEFQNDSDKEVFLQITPEWLHHIEFYQVNNEGVLKRFKIGGTMQPYNKRELAVNKHSFALDVYKGTYFIKIKGDHLICPHFFLGEKVQLLTSDRFLNHLYFLYFGVIFLLFIYNVFLTVVVRRKSYVFYSFYIFFIFIGMLFIKGFINEWVDLFWLSNHSNIITALMLICLLVSITLFTKAPEHYPVLNKIKRGIVIVAIISLILNLVGFARYANMIILNTVFAGGIWGLVVGFNTLRGGHPASIFIFLGYTSFIIGGLLHVMCLYEIIPYNSFTNNTYLIGSGLEVFFLSFSFAMNLNTSKKNKYIRQLKKLKDAAENEELVLEENKILEQRVEERTERLYDAYEEIQTNLNSLHKQKMQLEEKSRHVTDSITYAKRIQDALLPDLESIKKLDVDLGVFYEPKDILSGDFFWFGELGDKFIIVLADCTGHGVPGAMMTITGHNLLNKVVHQKRNNDVAKILSSLHVELVHIMNPERTDTEDGMDVQMLSIDVVTGEVCYAGAKNPIYFTDFENRLVRIKANPFSVGGTQTASNPVFTKHVLPPKWKNIFLSSDGFQDQFGENDKKFMVGKLKQCFSAIAEESVTTQVGLLKKQFVSWRGDTEQTDDVLVMSIKNKGLHYEQY